MATKAIVKPMLVHHMGETMRVLVPTTESDRDTFSDLRLKNEYKVTITKPRNPDHHRKGMRLLRDVYENQEKYETFEDLLVEFKLQCGWYTEHVTLGGKLIYVPKSLAFENMDQLEFETFYDRAVDVAIKFFGFTAAAEYV